MATGTKETQYEFKERMIQAGKQLELALKDIAFTQSDYFIKSFQMGLKTNALRLRPLKDLTITIKARKSFQYPRSPLYGKGEQEKNSIYNMLQAKDNEKAKHYEVSVRDAEHWDPENRKKGLTLQDIANIHEDNPKKKRPLFGNTKKMFKNITTKSELKVLLTKAISQYITKKEKKYFKEASDNFIAKMRF
jgi:hypothetical protein